MAHYLGIDIGTSGTKTLLMTDDGSVVATNNVTHSLQTPRPGWTEQTPDEWWKASCKSVKGLLKKSGVDKNDIKAIGLSGQMHGSVFLDKDNEVVRPAILWNDQRTAAECDEITKRAGGQKALLRMTGNVALTGYTAPKILWLRNHEKANFRKTKTVVLPKDYVRLQMTGDLATDVGDASGTLLLDVKNRKWSGKLLGKLDLDEAMLPKVYESPEVTGTLHKAGARAMGLAEGTPVVAGAGDVMSGALGNGIVSTGLINMNLGTGGVVCAHADDYTIDLEGAGRVATMCHAVPGKYVVFGCMLSAAGSFQWYADQVAHETPLKKNENIFEKLIKEAAETPAGAEGLFFLPYLTGERCPHSDPQARGAWIGLTRRHTKAHMTRALLEGVTHNMATILDIMRDMDVPVKQTRGTGGGAKSAFWRQLQADCYDAPLALTNAEEGGAYGVALLAAVAGGSIRSVEAGCKKHIRTTDVTKPNKTSAKAYRERRAVYNKFYHDLKDRFADLAALDA